MADKIPVNILLVDDQPAKLLSYESVLAGLGENLVRANSGNEALQQLLRREFAVVLVDVCMPELNGFDLAAMIRNHPRYRRTAVILVSGVMVEDMHRLKGYDSGAMDYVAVPIVPEILRAKVSVFAQLYRTTVALETLNNQLEGRVAERTAEIEAARHEAEHANRLKDEFLAMLSHELRTPLNAITGWTYLLRQGGLAAAERATALDTIERSALLQAQLINDLLDVSRIASGKLRLDCRRVDLLAVAHAALDSIRPQAEAAGVSLEAELPAASLALRGDPVRLQQVLANLLANAVKFAPPRGAVCLRMRCRPRSAAAADRLDSARAAAPDPLREVEIVVEDNGPGIAPDFLPHIFERFRQADRASTRSHKGLGLGLTIVRSLVELHGGAIVAGNRPAGSGAVFTVTLPMTPVGEPAAAPEHPQPEFTHSRQALRDVRVLVVDDEADGREVAAHVLERHGADALVAASADEALTLLLRERPDVLVADIEMPGEDGYDLLRRLRALPAALGGATPALALTAYAGPQDRERLFEAGFQRHLPKPVVPPDLVGAVAALAQPPGAVFARSR